jgi:hypothetical protein
VAQSSAGDFRVGRLQAAQVTRLPPRGQSESARVNNEAAAKEVKERKNAPRSPSNQYKAPKSIDFAIKEHFLHPFFESLLY